MGPQAARGGPIIGPRGTWAVDCKQQKVLIGKQCFTDTRAKYNKVSSEFNTHLHLHPDHQFATCGIEFNTPKR